MIKKIKILTLSKYGMLGASSRLRLFQFADYFHNDNFSLSFNILIDDVSLADRYKLNRYRCGSLMASYFKRTISLLGRHQYDLIWIEKEALPWIPACIERLLLKGVPYILDYDDAVFHQYDQHHNPIVRFFFGNRIDSLMAGARLVNAGNDYLANRARTAGAQRVELVPTVVDVSKYDPESTSQSSQGDLPRIVWIGSPSTSWYLEMLQEPLRDLSRVLPFSLRIIGADGFEMKGVNVELCPWSEETEVKLIRDCTIGVMPLHNSSWEQGKCGYKLIQYMACGLPVVASPVGVNCKIIEHGVNGFLANSRDEWYSNLKILLDDFELQRQFGFNGRKSVEKDYCVQVQAPRLVQMFRDVVSS